MKTTRSFIIIFTLLTWGAISGCQTQPESVTGENARYEPTWESLYEHNATPQWYQDAVLGFYFH